MAIVLTTELIELRKAILTMGAAVEQRLNQSIQSMLQHDQAAAETVRAGDDEIDEMEVRIEQECLRVLALSHPVAGDLRFILAVMRINSNLERIADHAQSIAKRVLDLEHLPAIKVPDALLKMIDETRQMFTGALKALADENSELARKVRRSDQRVDDLQKEIFAWVRQQISDSVESSDAVIDLLSVARKLERIADVSTNIAEDVIFVTEGAVVRHERE
jgi:phosphate transport system protein